MELAPHWERSSPVGDRVLLHALRWPRKHPAPALVTARVDGYGRVHHASQRRRKAIMPSGWATCYSRTGFFSLDFCSWRRCRSLVEAESCFDLFTGVLVMGDNQSHIRREFTSLSTDTVGIKGKMVIYVLILFPGKWRRRRSQWPVDSHRPWLLPLGDRGHLALVVR